MNKRYQIAVKWLRLFENQDTTIDELVNRNFVDDCKSLGFVSDHGKMFKKVYGDAFFDVDELDIVSATINDVNLLGSAIFSRWRGLTYWSFSPDEITHEVNRKWFGIAFRRLCELESVFRGELKQVQIFSHELKSVITPVLDEVIEQDIIINSEGKVTFTECTFEEKYQMKNDGKTSEFTIEKEKSVMLLNKLAKAFTYVPELLLSSDAGHWQVKLVNLEDEEYFYTGCFGDNEFINTVELSNEVRNTINKSNLYAFDGNYKYDSITRINVNYTRSTTVPDVSSKDEQNTPVIEYTETILVDRASETVEHTMKYSQIETSIKSIQRWGKLANC